MRIACVVVIAALAAPALATQPLRLECGWNGIEACSALITEFNERRNERAVKLRPRESNQVGPALAAGECFIGVVQDSLAPATVETLGDGFEALPLARFVVEVIVNASSPVRRVTADELDKIFRGQITSWRDVGGSRVDYRIELYSLRPARPETYIFRKTLVKGGPMAEILRDPKADPPRCKRTSEEVIGAVIKQHKAIGFVRADCQFTLDARVRALGIAKDSRSPPVLPSPNTIADGSYPATDNLTLYLHPDAPPVARDFCEFATGPEGAKIIRQFGLWPEYELEKVRAEQRVADVKAGKGQPVAVCDLAGVGEAIRAAGLEFARAKMAVQVTFDAAGGSRSQAVARLKTGEAELLLVDGGLEETLRGQGMEEGGAEMALGSRAVGVVVHPGNSFNELTMDDLRQILAGKVDRWPGATGTAERMVLYALPANNPLMQLVDQAMRPDMKRTKATVRPDSGRVILSVAAQPGALGLVDLTKVARHETKVKLLAILPPGKTEAAPPAPDRVPEGYPLASPVALHLSPKASDAARAMFAFLKDGNARDALLAGGLVPRPLPDATEAEVAEAYGAADEPQAASLPAHVAAAKEDDSPATVAPDRLHDVLRGALGGEQGVSPAGVASAAVQADADQTAENAAAVSTPPDPNRPTPRQAEETEAEETEAIPPAPGEGGVPHPAASEPAAAEADFAAWATARAVPIGLIGLGVTAVAIALGSLGMKRVRYRKEVMRRYRP